MRFERRVLWAVAAILTLSACNLSPDAKEARFLEKGRKELAKNNYAVAILHFKNASEAKPWDAEPYYQLGLVYLAGSDFKSAVTNFQKAVELNPRHTGAQLKLAQMMATSPDKKNLEEAQKHAQAVLGLLKDDPDALNVLAVTDLRLGKPESAQPYLEQALRKSPSHLNSWAVLAQVKLARKDVVGAEKALVEASTQLPKSPGPRIYLGEFYLTRGRTAEAEQQFRQALALDPKNGPALMNLGAMQAKAGHTDQAEQTYRQAAALADKRYRLVHAEFLYQSGKRDQALAEFEKLAAADPDLVLRTKLVDTYLALNRHGDAEKVLTAALKKNGLDQDALMRRSQIYLDSGRYTEAEADLNQVLHLRKDSAEAYYFLAKASQGLANPTKQKQELEEALKIDRNFLAARVDLAAALLAARSPQPALTLLDEAPENQMNDGSRILERNWVLLALGKKDEARNGVDRMLAGGKVPEALLQDAVLKLDQKDYAGARKSIEEALSRAPEDTRALFALMQTYAGQKQTPEAVQILKEYALKQPNSPFVQQFLGQILLASGDRDGARKAFEAATTASPGFAEADYSLAELDAAEDKVDDARKRLLGVVSTHPDNKKAHQFLADFEATTGKNPAAAIEQYRKAVAIDPKDASSWNNMAYLLTQGKQLDEALKCAQKAKELAPDNPDVDGTLGWVYYQQGSYPLAVVHLETATAKGGGGENPAIREYYLAMAYLKDGKPDRGRQTLDAALKMNPNLPEAQAARQAFGINSK